MSHLDATLDRRDGGLRVGCTETAEACQIAQRRTMWRGNPGRFDIAEGLGVETSGQIDLKEVDILPDGGRRF